MPAKAFAEIIAGEVIRIITAAGRLRVWRAGELIRMIHADEDHLRKPHVICQLNADHRDGRAFPAAFGQISEEPASQAAARPEESHVIGEADEIAIVPSDELGYAQLLNVAGALLDHELIRAD